MATTPKIKISQMTADPAPALSAMEFVEARAGKTWKIGGEPLAALIAQSALDNGFVAWAKSYTGLQPLPVVMASPPTITIGASNAVSAITGAANGTVMFGPTDPLLTWPGNPPITTIAGYYQGDRTGKRIRFRHTGRRFEIRMRSSFARMPTIMVDGEINTKTSIQAGMDNSGNHLLLVDFGADTSISKAVAVMGVSSGGSGYAVGDEITLAGGTSTTKTVLRVIAVSSGAVAGLSIKTPGSYSVIPTNNVSQDSTTGSGTDCTVTMMYGGTHTTKKSRGIEIVLPNNGHFGGLNIDANDVIAPWPELLTTPKLVITGDSFTEYQQTDYPAGTWARQVAYYLGLQDRFTQFGTSGRGYLSLTAFSLDLAGLIAENPDMLVIALGVNDVLTGTAPATMQATATANIQTLMNGLPSCRFVVLTPWFLEGNLAYADAIIDACADLSDQTRVRTVNLETIDVFTRSGTATDYICSDYLHPTQIGHDHLASSLASLIAGAFVSMAAN